MKQIYFIFLCPLLLLTACEKEKDQPTSTNTGCTKTIFECKINGEPFTYYHEYPCNGLSVFYDSVQFGLHIVGIDCRLWRNEYGSVGFESPTIKNEGIHLIQFANVGLINNEGQPVPHNIVIGGEVNLLKFKKPTDNQTNHQGYAQGTFWFTVYGEDTMDTIKITEGKFCVEI